MKAKVIPILAVAALLGAGVGAAATQFMGGAPSWDRENDAAIPPAAPQPIYRFARPDGMAPPGAFPTFDEVPHSGQRWWKYKGSAWKSDCLIDYFDAPLTPNDNDRDSWTPSAACCCDAPQGIPVCPPEYR